MRSKQIVISREDFILAHHEAAHAVIALAVGRPLRFVRLTEDGAGATSTGLDWETCSREDLAMEMLVGFAAAPHTEKRLVGYIDKWSCGEDLAMVHRLALAIWPDRFEGAVGLVDAARRAEALVEAHWESIERVALTLALKRRLSGRQVRRLMGQAQ